MTASDLTTEPNRSDSTEVTRATFLGLTLSARYLAFDARGDFPDLTGRATVAIPPSNPV
jgi:hypothetical protein